MLYDLNTKIEEYGMKINKKKNSKWRKEHKISFTNRGRGNRASA